MNKIYIIILLCIFTTSDILGQNMKSGKKNESFAPINKKEKINNAKDSVLVNSIYNFDAWTEYFKPTKTKDGAIIKFKFISDSSYILQWGKLKKLKTFQQTFNLDGHETWIPKLIDENKNYLVFRQGCGNPCWTGYFLPKNDSVNPLSVSEYLGYDLIDNLVVYVKNSNTLEIINIKTRKVQDIELKGCKSAFPGYCIKNLTIKDKILRFKWIPDTYINSEKGEIITVQIK